MTLPNLESMHIWRKRITLWLTSCCILFFPISIFSQEVQCTTLISTNTWTPVEVLPGFSGEPGDSLFMDINGTVDSIVLHNISGEIASTSIFMYLESPDGELITLLNQEGCFANPAFDFGLHDQASSSISGCLPSSGYYDPVGDFTDFAGLQTKGRWKFWVSDHSEQNGTISGWQIEICYSPTDVQVGCPPDVPDSNCNYYPRCETELLNVPNIGAPFNQYFAIHNNQYVYTINHGLKRYDLYNGASAETVTTIGDPYDAPSSQITRLKIHNDKMVWHTQDNNMYKIWMLDLLTDTLLQLTHEDDFYVSPEIQDSIICWRRGNNIEYYNINTGLITQIYSQDYFGPSIPATNGRFIVWHSEPQSGGNKTFRYYDILNPIEDGVVLGTVSSTVGRLHFSKKLLAFGTGFNNGAEIKLIDFNDVNSGIQSITHNLVLDGDISISNDTLIWVKRFSSPSQHHLMFYDHSNPQNPVMALDTFSQISHPVVNGPFITFRGYDGESNGMYLYDFKRPDLKSKRFAEFNSGNEARTEFVDGLIVFKHGHHQSYSQLGYFYPQHLIDQDGDGYCTPWDCDDTNPAKYFSAPCDDMNSNTINDIITENCICEGQLGNKAYVDKNATGQNTGVSWEHAFTSLQDAVELNEIDTILVAEGTYIPSAYPQGCDNCANDPRLYSFRLPTGVKMFGGFPSGGAPMSSRDPIAHPTIISGEVGVAGSMDNLCHLIIQVTTTPSIIRSTIDGFIFEDANADGNGIGSLPKIDGVTIQASQGGGLYLNGHLQIELNNNIFRNNMVDNTSQGSAIYAINTDSLLVSNCDFNNNIGGKATIHLVNCKSNFKKCSFDNNISNSQAGLGVIAMFNSPTSGYFSDCVFSNNRCTNALSFAGAAFVRNTTFERCLFINNSAYRGGALMFNEVSNTSKIINCLFVKNNAYDKGGAIYKSSNNDLIILNSTFSGNEASNEGGGLYLSSHGDVDVYNSIFFNNSDNIIDDGVSLTAINNLIDGNSPYPGSGNIIGDPMFQDTMNMNYAPSVSSIVINQGDNTLYSNHTNEDIDLVLNPRFTDSIIDMGAYEYTDQCHHPDYLALEAFYNATNGQSWTNNTGWLTNCTPCNWFGITCDINDRVLDIDLQVNNLSGTLPIEILSLTQLRNLKLGVNNISGVIPVGFGSLSNLESLWLHNNNLSDSIPSDIGNSTSLQRLYLNNNPILSGSIPGSLGDISTLVVLRTNNTSLSGCYDENLQKLCSQLGQFSSNAEVSAGTNLDAEWEDFCICGAGICDCTDTNVWIGGQGDWNEDSNWSLGHIPLRCEKVEVLNGKVSLPFGYSTTIYLLEVGDQAQLDIPPSSGIQVTGDPSMQILNDCSGN